MTGQEGGVRKELDGTVVGPVRREREDALLTEGLS